MLEKSTKMFSPNDVTDVQLMQYITKRFLEVKDIQEDM